MHELRVDIPNARFRNRSNTRILSQHKSCWQPAAERSRAFARITRIVADLADSVRLTRRIPAVLHELRVSLCEYPFLNRLPITRTCFRYTPYWQPAPGGLSSFARITRTGTRCNSARCSIPIACISSDYTGNWQSRGDAAIRAARQASAGASLACAGHPAPRLPAVAAAFSGPARTLPSGPRATAIREKKARSTH